MEQLRVHIKQAGYDTSSPVIRDIRFAIRPGEIVGLIGANGAGKSTLIKSILNVIDYLEGDVSFQGKQETLAYVPEQPIYLEDLTLWEHLELAASVYQLEQEQFRQNADRLLLLFDLQDKKHRLPSSFSKGMQQKMMLVIAFLIRPALYVVDEPFIGLDPKATRILIQRLEQERDHGAGILLSTHVLDTAEKLCDRLLVIDRGRLIADGTLEELRLQSGLAEGSLTDIYHRLLERSI
ncbi:MAG: ABC transporter ATP-binding protein [Bacillaceae bacterium]|nr:ABC transporter ATP-binding protein [Bacillaceae bacterium]